jgi:hypothetical protein
MTTLSRATVNDALYAADLDESALYEDYSGRAMYGASCFGLVCDAGGFAAFCAAFAKGNFTDDDPDVDWLSKVRTDSMGLSTIWYWPGVTVEKEED